MKIGILGGSFNPVHEGHINIAVAARDTLELDLMYLMPAGVPPHKDTNGFVSRFLRMEMVKEAVCDIPDIEVLDFEIYKDEKCYTYETVRSLKEMHLDDELYFVIGEDSLDMFESWVHPEIICQNAVIAVASRSDMARGELLDYKLGVLQEKFNCRFVNVKCNDTPVSSTNIRKMLTSAGGRPDYLPERVYRFICERHLYGYDADFEISNEDIGYIKKKLKKKLKKSRYQHTLGVADTARNMAMRYGYPLERAYVAGLLHDCAKGLTVSEQIEYCKENKIRITESEKKAPWLLHAKVGADIASKKFGIHDKEILSAIRYHTTGCPDMSILDKIIFIADYIEPGRFKQMRLSEIRTAAFIDIDLCMRMILKDTIKYLNSGDAHMDEMTLRTFEFYNGSSDLFKN